MRKPVVLLLAAPLVSACLAPELWAASHTWAGAGITGYWSLPANWSANNPPVAGETPPVTITFPSGAARLNNTNNVGGLVIDSILFSGTGYTLNGSGTGTNITLQGGSGPIVYCLANTTNTFAASLEPVLVNNVQFTVNSPGSLYLDSIVRGSGGLTKQGGGLLTYYANYANTYSGNTYVRAGTLNAFCGSFSVPQLAIPGYLEIGGSTTTATVQLLAGSQLSTTAHTVVDGNGSLELNNYSATCGPLTLKSGEVDTGTGTLALNGNVDGGGGVITGHLSLGGVTRQFTTTNADIYVLANIIGGSPVAGIIANGPGALDLASSNSISGPVTVAGGSLLAMHSLCFGTGAGGVTVHNGAQLVLMDQGFGSPAINNVNLTLNGTGIGGAGALASACLSGLWGGPVYLASDSLLGTWNVNMSLTIAGAITGPGALTCGGTGPGPGFFTLSGSGDNTFAGPLTLTGTNTLYLSKSSGATAVPGSLVIGNDTDPGDSALVKLLANNQIANSATVTIHQSGALNLNGYNETIGPLTMAGGDVFTGAGTLTLGGDITALGYNWSALYDHLSLGGNTRTISGPGSLQLTCSISDGGGAAGLVMAGSGYVDLQGSNSFSGTLTIQNGGVFADNAYAFGSTGQGVVVTNYGYLELEGYAYASEPLTLADPSGYALGVFGANLWSGPVTLLTPSLLISSTNTDQLTINSAISGPGGLELVGGGTLTFSGSQDNTYSGLTTVDDGLLLLLKAYGHRAVSGNLVVGNDWELSPHAEVRLLVDNQLTANSFNFVSVKHGGFFNLNNHLQTIGQLFLSDTCQVDSGPSGLLSLNGNVNASVVNGGYSYISGRLSLGGVNRVFNVADGTEGVLSIDAMISDGGPAAGFTMTGGGGLYLDASNSFSGTVIVDNGALWILNNYALGATNGGVIATNQGSLVLENVNIGNEPLTLAGSGLQNGGPLNIQQTNSWAGPIQLAHDAGLYGWATDSVFTASGPISGPGGFFPSGAATVRFTGTAANTFTGTLGFSAALLELNKTNALAVYGPLQINSGTVRYRSANQILDTSPVTVNPSALFDLNSFSDIIGDLSGAGSVNLGNGILTVGGSNPTNTFSGVISGPGGELDKVGPNTLILSGNNTYTSATMVKGGTLFINGSQPASDVYVYSGATLGGNGSVANVHSTGGTISPGMGPGKLTINGNAILDGTSTVCLELRGTSAGVNYDQLNNVGQLAANGAALQLTMGFNGAVSNQYVIVNHPSGLTSTIFDNLPEAGIVTANNGATFRLSYVGGDGNDTVLTQLSTTPAPQVGSVTNLGPGGIQFFGTGVPNLTYTVQATTNLVPATWLNLGSTTANGVGKMIYTDAQAKNYPRRFYRFVWP